MTNWLPIPRFNDVYWVSDDGQFGKRRASGEIHPMSLRIYQDSPYLHARIVWEGRRFVVAAHREIAKVWLPNPSGFPQVRHLNDVKDDNRVANLRWGTAKQNTADRVRNGGDALVRAAAEQTHCKKGLHERTPENLVTRTKTDGRTTQTCKPCELERNTRAYANNAEKRRAYARDRITQETPEQRLARLEYQREYHRTH